MRVAFDSTAVDVSAAGAGRVAADLAQALQAEPGLDMDFIHSRRFGGTRLPRAFAGMYREAAWYPVILPRSLRRSPPDVVHFPAPLGTLRSPVPVVLTIHDILPWRYPELFGRWNAAHQRHVVRRLIERASVIVASSDFTRADLLDVMELDAERVLVAPPGVDPRFRPVAAGDRTMRLVGSDEPFVLAVGTLEPRKNLVTLISAMEMLAEDGLRLPLVVAGGKGWRDEGLRARLRSSPAWVVPVGRVPDDDLVALYSAASCMAFPSLYEGFGLPVLEAMACGTPVVAADTSSLPEVVGDAGILVPPVDAGALAEAIRSVVTDPLEAAAMSERGVARAAGFTWARTAGAYRDAYRLAVGSAGPASTPEASP